MINVVLDTNVLVAAFRSRTGASFQLLRLLGIGASFRPCLSVPLVLEYEMALRRLADVDDARITAVLDYLCQISELKEIFFLWRPFLSDPGDEMVLEVAVGGRAEVIVTHNLRDFAGVEDRFGIRVLSPAAFLIEIRGKS